MPVENLEFVDKAVELVARARAAGVEVRILGSLAYRLHCPANLELFERMKRDLTDLDLAARSDQRKEVRDFLTASGFVIDKDVLAVTEGKRYVFAETGTNLNVDVFFDELFFCHPIPLRDRLQLDYPTITPTDLLLEKMQIVQINPKDVKDTLVLVLEHRLAARTPDTIDHEYIADMLAKDWGFYHTVTTNLAYVRAQLEDGTLQPEQADVVRTRLDELLDAIEKEPKTTRWKIRSRVGTRVKWYQEVAEKAETF